MGQEAWQPSQPSAWRRTQFSKGLCYCCDSWRQQSAGHCCCFCSGKGDDPWFPALPFLFWFIRRLCGLQACVGCSLWLSSSGIELDVIYGPKDLEKRDDGLVVACVRQLAHPVGVERGDRTKLFLYLLCTYFRSSQKGISYLLRKEWKNTGDRGWLTQCCSLALTHGFCIFFPALSSALLERPYDCVSKASNTVQWVWSRRAVPRSASVLISWCL